MVEVLVVEVLVVEVLVVIVKAALITLEPILRQGSSV